jgi:serine-type D-Ala-D-Ala carboxypeptidase (penicillin-binding protein 5/6)
MIQIILSLLPFLLTASVYAVPLSMKVSAESAILINAKTGQVLYSKEPYALHYPASTTKIATVLYFIKTKKNIDEMITIQKEAVVSLSDEAKAKASYRNPAYWLEPDGCHVGLKAGEQMTVRDLFYCSMLASANDASNSIALLGGSIPAFMEQVNAYLKSIGCHRTNFLNPHGLHHPDHKTCAYDLALMGIEGLKEPLFKEIVSTVQFTRPKTNVHKSYIILNGNRLLRPGKCFYDKAIGIKTGFHSRAKHAFVGAAQSGDRTLILVFLKCADRTKMFEEAKQLFEAAFKQPKVEQTYLNAGVQPFSRKYNFADREINTYLQHDLKWSYYPAEDLNPACLLYWNDLSLPITKGQKVGEIHLIAESDRKVLHKLDLFADNDVELSWPYRWIASMRVFIYTYPLLASLMMVFCIGLSGLCLMMLWSRGGKP